MGSLILAVRFLTLLPVPGREAEGPSALGRAAWWFPVVGLALGGALAGADRILGIFFSPVLSALLVLSIDSEPSGFFTSHAQPEPKVVTAVAVNFSLNCANDQKVWLIASANAPVGSPPPLGARQFQKKV